ncbi:ethylene-overproduction protein 1 [Asparagus officinalis]|uniref:ethylene-overproduction protein 1 n=1 Tax=Asparagus officinalis TaxID=4686 RepID=UPI00098E1680|nr:ethylene-overproduction protein 1 [Asparagus officinalis]
MQNTFLTTIRSLKLIDGCKGTQVYAVKRPPPAFSSAAASTSLPPPQSPTPTFSIRTKSTQNPSSSSSSSSHHHRHSSSIILDTLLPYGLPSADQIDPPIDPFLRPVDPVAAFAASFRSVDNVGPEMDGTHSCNLYLEQMSLVRALLDAKLTRRCLRSARIHAPDVHHKVVLSAWLRFERRADELISNGPSLSPKSPLCPCSATSPALECPKAALQPGYSPDSPFDPCPCRIPREASFSAPASLKKKKIDDDDEGDLWFCIGDEEVGCVRHSIAALSQPLRTLLYGDFVESRRERINFTQNNISVKGMRAVDVFSRTGSLSDFTPETVLELLGFANTFCCEDLKAKCDAKLAGLVWSVDDALLLIEHGLYETAHLLVAACLQAFLRELPKSLNDPEIAKVLCTPEGKSSLEACGHASFALYNFLSQVAMEEDMKSNMTVMLLERLEECAMPGWQRQLALHQLGCVMLERGEYKDAQKFFEQAVACGHVYSVIGIARAKFKKGHKYSAYKITNRLIHDHGPAGWMYQERSLYCSGKEKMMDLSTATELDATLPYPYKYKAVALAEEAQIGSAITEINKILAFKVSTDCLELRAWFSLVLQNYESALQDIRAIMTLDPGYMIFHGKIPGDQMIEILKQYVQEWDMADCWMQLYDRWSAVDDIGSLAVVHQMLAKEPGNSSLRFRQSLLLLRLNCQKAAMHSLRLAHNHSQHEYERLVYEGWILYDTGHRKEALTKAEESIAIQRSFEAFFLKAYALADANLDQSSSSYVIQLLEQANSCASDNLRKGQAHNNMGSVYVDCEMLDEAAECYTKALGIKHTRAHQGLARVYYLKNEKKAAYDEMTKLIEKAKNNASAYEKRSEYCERDMAKSDLNVATKLDPLRTYPYRYRAAVLMDEGKEEEAITELSRAISFKPDLNLLHLRAAFYDSMGKAEATLRDCEAALCLDPNHADTLELYNRAKSRVTEQQST